jgi:two-component system, sensor histidine kinase and response regulator
LKLLNNFHEKFSNFENEIKSLYQENKMNDGERLAHTLKGVSGNIGAMEVFKSAAELELKFKKNEITDIDKDLESVKEKLQYVLDELFLSFKPAKSEEKPEDLQPLDNEKLNHLIDELIALLEDDDYEASEKIDKMNQLPGIKKYEKEIKEISRKISDYEFEAALELTQKLKTKINT